MSSQRGKVSLEVLQGPMDGLRIVTALESLAIGRGDGNDLQLYSDISVSGRHAVLRATDRPSIWNLVDLESTNGTWVGGGRLRQTKAAHPIALGETFMLGGAVVRLAAAADSEESYLPSLERLREEPGRLLSLCSGATLSGYGAAVALAVQERRPWLSARDLFLGLLMLNPHLPLCARPGGALSGSQLLAIWRREPWSGDEAWITERFHALATEASVFFEDDLVVTPRLLRLLRDAEQEVQDRGRASIEPTDVLRALLSDATGLLRQVLERERLDPQRLIELCTRVEPTLDRADAVTIVTAPSSGRASRASVRSWAPPPISSGDPRLDRKARETADRLEAVGSLYRLAAPLDRRQAIRDVLNQEMAQLEAGERGPFLEQLRRLFPVEAGTVAVSGELARLNDQIANLRSELGRREADGAAASAALSADAFWSVIRGNADPRSEWDASHLARFRVQFLAEVLTFANHLELFILGLVQSLSSRGDVSGEYRLPGHRGPISNYLRELDAGTPLEADEVRAYLRELESWLVAAVSAYHESPRIWFAEEFWQRFSPKAIESRVGGGGVFGPGKAWNAYREAIRPMGPDIVEDQIYRIVRRRASEQQARFAERRDLA